jgi:hypothetical protein
MYNFCRLWLCVDSQETAIEALLEPLLTPEENDSLWYETLQIRSSRLIPTETDDRAPFFRAFPAEARRKQTDDTLEPFFPALAFIEFH